MLVLTRKIGDVIAIGDNIKIVVMAIKGKQVRLGIQADKNTLVHREEVYQKIQQEIKAARDSDADAIKAADALLRHVAAENVDVFAADAQNPRRPRYVVRKNKQKQDGSDLNPSALK